MIIKTMTVDTVGLKLKPRALAGGLVEESVNGAWRLSLPEGKAGHYRLAQLDDYSQISRSQFPWRPPLQIELRARASSMDLPGTWGFGLWNDPFITDFGFAGGARRLPVLPNTAWFFFASRENYLSLEDHLPAHGELAATFRSETVSPVLLALAIPALPFFKFGTTSRLLRKAGRRWIDQDAATLIFKETSQGSDVTGWHSYTIKWWKGGVTFELDGQTVLNTPVSPSGPLGLVIWIDNQYAALPPGGGLAFGTLPNPAPAWIEIADLVVSPAA